MDDDDDLNCAYYTCSTRGEYNIWQPINSMYSALCCMQCAKVVALVVFMFVKLLNGAYLFRVSLKKVKSHICRSMSPVWVP